MSGALVPAWRRVQLLLRARLAPLLVLGAALGGIGLPLMLNRPDAWLDVLGASLVILSAVAAVLLSAGLVSGDLRTGAIQLWLQKPVRAVPFYLGRWAEAAVAAVIVVCLVVLAARLGILWLGWPARMEILHLLPRLVFTVVLVSSIGFALSAWLIRGGATIGALAIFFTGITIERELAERGEPLGPLLTVVVRAVLFPESALVQVTDHARGLSDGSWGALARIVLYVVVWLGLGSLGVRRAVQSGIARTQGSAGD